VQCGLAGLLDELVQSNLSEQQKITVKIDPQDTVISDLGTKMKNNEERNLVKINLSNKHLN